MALSNKNVTVANSVEGAVTEIITMDCEVSAAVDNLVRLDPVTNNKVLVATDNTVKDPVIGRIKEKLTPITCRVILRGVVDTPGLARGKIFLSPGGTLTDTPPTTNYLQPLGYSFGNNKMHLDPSTIVTKLS
jgi:hypothetical protein